MKKIGATLAVLGLLLMVAAGCGSPSSVDSSVDSESASSSNLQPPYSDVKAGMTEQQVIDILGEPMGRSSYDLPEGRETNLMYLNGKVTVWLKNGVVTKVD